MFASRGKEPKTGVHDENNERTEVPKKGEKGEIKKRSPVIGAGVMTGDVFGRVPVLKNETERAHLRDSVVPGTGPVPGDVTTK